MEDDIEFNHAETDQKVRREFEAWRAQVGQEDQLLQAAEEEQLDSGVGPGSGRGPLIASVTSDEARSRGNELFDSGSYQLAEKWYNTAADAALTDVERALAMSNRALVKLKRGNELGALQDAESVLDIADLPSKLRQKTLVRRDVAQKALDGANAAELRRRGNEAFLAGKADSAHRLYSASILKSGGGEERSLGYSNRSLVNLKLARFTEAEFDARAALESGLPSAVEVKTKSRLGRALFEQGRALDAVQLLESTLEEHPDNKDVEKDLIAFKRASKTHDSIENANSGVPSKLASFAPPDTREPPQTFYEFERVWRELHSTGSVQRRIRYLQTIPTSRLPQLIGDGLSPELFDDVMDLLKDVEDSSYKWVLDLLDAMSSVRRFSLIRMLSGNAARNAVADFLQRVDRVELHDIDFPATLQRVKASYL